jgi:hypothetical protein
MTPLYYGGEPKNLGLVSALPQTSFADLVKEVFRQPVQLPLTRAQFRALPERDAAAPKDQQRVKRTRFVIPSAIPDTRERRSGNVASCNLVFLDIDAPKDPCDDIPAVAILAQLDDMVNVLAPFSFAIYHTASSTHHLPRLRVVVAADAIPPEHYPAAVSLVARLLGLEEVTSESNVVCQPMFVPVIFRGEDTSPLIAEHLDGRALTVADLDGVELPTSSRSHSASAAGEADLDYLRPPVVEITVDDARDALTVLDPDMDRKVWISVGAALKHQFGEEGIDLWREWSSKGSKYAGDEDVETQWRSLKPSPRGRLPVTIRSVLKLATEAGWSSEKVAQKCYSAVAEWLSDDDRTEIELMKHGAARIAAAPALSHIERGALINRLGTELKKRGVAVSRTDLNRQFRAVEVSSRGKGGDDKTAPDNMTPPWAKEIIYVSTPNIFYKPITGQRWSVESFNNAFSKYLMPAGEVDGDARPPVLPQHYLLNQLKVGRVDDFIYDPSQADTNTVHLDGKKYSNTYRRTYPDTDYKRADEAGVIVMRHCSELFNTPEEASIVLDWMCYVVQNPGSKALWAILLQGAEGCGKSLWFEMLRRVLGPTNVKEVSAHSVMESNWTEWAADCQAVNIPEIRVVGESRHSIMNKLKTLISDKTISIDQRNRDTRSVPNHASYFLTTNHTDALALTENDRRYYVVFSRIQSKLKVRELQQSGHFDRVFEMLETNAGGLRAWLLERRISPGFNPVIAPESRYKSEMLDAAASPLHRAVELAISDKDAPLVLTDLVSTTALRNILEAEHRGLGRFTDQSLGAVLRDLGFTSAGRIRLGNSRHSVWVRGVAIEAAAALAQTRLNTLSDDRLI